jgi:hypothetical protein
MTVGYRFGLAEDARYQHEEFSCDGECSMMRFNDWIKKHRAVHVDMFKEDFTRG